MGASPERSTFYAYGAAESDYRPERWGGFREDYRFTGKEEDVEVGLVYFGKRLLNPLLGRWVSPDPMAVQVPGEADWNLYAYVRGSLLQNVDPVGLDEAITGVLQKDYEGHGLTAGGTTTCEGLDCIDSKLGGSTAEWNRTEPETAPVAPAAGAEGASREERWGAAKAAAWNFAVEGAQGLVESTGPATPVGPLVAQALSYGAEALKAPEPPAEPTNLQEYELREAYDFMHGGLVFESAALSFVAGGVAAEASTAKRSEEVVAAAERMVAGSRVKTATEMADDLTQQIGRNRVGARTASGRVDVDLRGKGHFDKARGERVDTPHVHERTVHVGPTGKSSLGPKTTRPATKQDVRTARKLARREGLLR